MSIYLTGGSGTSTAVAGGSYSAFILNDSLSVRWAVTVNTTGHLVSTARASGPSGALIMNQIVLNDNTGILWKLSINTIGDLITTQYAGWTPSIEQILLEDSLSVTWIVSVIDAGNLVTT